MPRIVALDLGSGNIKATVWNSSGRKASFVERLIHPVPQDGSEEPGLEQQLVAVGAMLEEHPELTSAGNVIAASYGGRHVSVHRVELPFSDKRQFEQALPFAVEDEVPFDLDDMVLGWRVLEQGEAGTRAMVALVEEESLRLTLEGLAGQQIEPRRVVSDKELLARWGVPQEPAVSEDIEGLEHTVPVVAVLDVGHTRTIASLVRGGELLGSRVMDIGGSDVTRAIQDGLRCSWANAERLKHGQPPLPDPEPVPAVEEDPTAEPALEVEGDEDDTDTGVVLPVVPLTPWDQLPAPGIEHLPPHVRSDVDRVVQRLLAEVRSTLIGFEDSLGIEVDEVHMGGGTARLPGLHARVSEDLGVPVHWASGTEGPIPCEFMLSDALAEVVAGQVQLEFVDLRAGALRWRSAFNLLQAMVTYGGALVVFFSVALGGLYVWQSWSIASEIEATQTSIDDTIKKALPDVKTRSSTVAMSKMRERIDEAEARAKALGDNAEPPAVGTIYHLSNSLPPAKDLEIDVTRMTVTPRALTFEAEVPSYAAADQVEVALQGTERFESCTKSGEQQRRGRITFDVKCEFGENANGEEG